MEPISARERTIDLMREGVDVIAQASLVLHPWQGRADILLRVATPSNLGFWSYEVIDTKLARQTRAETILQLCLYAEMIESVQGSLPERIGVVTPESFDPTWYRTLDYMAYFRRVKRSLLAAADGRDEPTYPDPVERCEVCRWHPECRRVWRKADHLSLVAGISRGQRRELVGRGFATMQHLAELPLPIPFKPDRGSRSSYERVREQARIQVEGRDSGRPTHELKPVEDGLGLGRLPVPSRGDVFFDLEGDHFVGERGLEYLFGITYLDEAGNAAYDARWAFDGPAEKAAFEWAVDFIEERRKLHPDLHIYHYAPYEPSAMKRLMGDYATRESVVDEWLRGHLFVDLHRVVKESLIASVERYSIKDLEIFFGFVRDVALPDAGASRAALEMAIEFDGLEAIGPDIRDIVLGYNKDDCDATLALRDWLESVRQAEVLRGVEIGRPLYKEAEAPARESEHRERLAQMAASLTTDVPEERSERTSEQHARWLLAHCLGYYQREGKVDAWEYYRMVELALEDYPDETQALAGLEFVGEVGGTEKAPIHRYHYPPQECQIGLKSDLYAWGGQRLGELDAHDKDGRLIDIQKTGKAKEIHPEALYAKPAFFSQKECELALMRIAECVTEQGFADTDPFRSGRDLLLGSPPRLVVGAFHAPEDPETLIDESQTLVRLLDRTNLPIQGPPGSGKTFLGAHLIVDLVKHGAKVGVTSNSHEVVLKMLDDVVKEAGKLGVAVNVAHKGDSERRQDSAIRFCGSNDDALNALQDGVSVLGGTKFLWARSEFANAVDYLFVDEASQLALADALAVSHAAKSTVFIGDPRQLERPQKGSHPPGVGVSPLDQLMNGALTCPPDQGIFLPMTRRLHPALAKFTSEVFYESRLWAEERLQRQYLEGTGMFDGAGPFLVSVPHVGNQSSSSEEVECIAYIVDRLVATGTWTDAEGESRRLRLEDIVVVAPYNFQVGAIRDAIPGINVGTVDKFQGKEAPVAIYSMTTSSPDEAPRGIGFLYSLNRLNVATSRALSTAIVVASPALLEVDCRSPEQIRLVSALCRFEEMANWVPKADSADM